MKNVKIAPSILAADFSQLGEDIQKAAESGADLIHFDIMDGHFVPNLTMGVDLVKAVRRYTDLPFDVHLMVTHPQDYIESFVDVGANLITIHAEIVTAPIDVVIGKIKSLNVLVGLATRPQTPISVIDPYLPDLDLVLPMSVEPGFGGQKFMLDTLEKISYIDKRIKEIGKSIDLEVDGGINEKTAPLVIERGATILVAGTAIFKQSNYADAISQLRH
ncbi:MAG: ribulose-phosphate 3-epimerase [Candidatus Poribacteria bacterium]|nr:ribulose-phosphate 3-epimerase [Candidatus Poribacteria bacterium]